ncbi:MAG: hypothetical protein RLZZ502_684, partial [Pseudomonadota bacterium]
AFYSMGDHTTGTGNMMVVNGGGQANTAWSQSVAVTAGTQYDLSAWAANVCCDATFNFNFPGSGLELIIMDGVTSTSIAAGSTGLAGVWNKLSGNWTATSTGNVTVAILNTVTALNGNDFALDDISMTAVSNTPVPASLLLLAVGLLGFGTVRRR